MQDKREFRGASFGTSSDTSYGTIICGNDQGVLAVKNNLAALNRDKNLKVWNYDGARSTQAIKIGPMYYEYATGGKGSFGLLIYNVDPKIGANLICRVDASRFPSIGLDDLVSFNPHEKPNLPVYLGINRSVTDVVSSTHQIIGDLYDYLRRDPTKSHSFQFNYLTSEDTPELRTTAARIIEEFKAVHRLIGTKAVAIKNLLIEFNNRNEPIDPASIANLEKAFEALSTAQMAEESIGQHARSIFYPTPDPAVYAARIKKQMEECAIRHPEFPAARRLRADASAAAAPTSAISTSSGSGAGHDSLSLAGKRPRPRTDVTDAPAAAAATSATIASCSLAVHASILASAAKRPRLGAEAAADSAGFPTSLLAAAMASSSAAMSSSSTALVNPFSLFGAFISGTGAHIIKSIKEQLTNRGIDFTVESDTLYVRPGIQARAAAAPEASSASGYSAAAPGSR